MASSRNSRLISSPIRYSFFCFNVISQLQFYVLILFEFLYIFRSRDKNPILFPILLELMMNGFDFNFQIVDLNFTNIYIVRNSEILWNPIFALNCSIKNIHIYVIKKNYSPPYLYTTKIYWQRIYTREKIPPRIFQINHHNSQYTHYYAYIRYYMHHAIDTYTYTFINMQ